MAKCQPLVAVFSWEWSVGINCVSLCFGYIHSLVQTWAKDPVLIPNCFEGTVLPLIFVWLILWVVTFESRGTVCKCVNLSIFAKRALLIICPPLLESKPVNTVFTQTVALWAWARNGVDTLWYAQICPPSGVNGNKINADARTIHHKNVQILCGTVI